MGILLVKPPTTWAQQQTLASNSAPDLIWVDDDQGLRHARHTDQTPEPYRSAWRYRLKQASEQRRRAVVSPDHFGDTIHIDQQRQQRLRWQTLMATWRERLLLSTEHYAQILRRRQELTMNPLLVVTPLQKNEIASTVPELEAAIKDINKAKQMLTGELLNNARREHVPPVWLE